MSDWQVLVQRANTDPQFRDRLKANPVAAAKEAGVDLPAGATIEVVEQRPNELHLLLDRRTKDTKINQMLDKAASDAAFKQQLLANPKKCVDAATGQPLPAGTKVHIHERDPNRIRVWLSPSQDDELSDAELEAVAGGGFFKQLWSNITCRNERVTVTQPNPTGGTDIITGIDPTTPGDLGDVRGGAGAHIS